MESSKNRIITYLHCRNCLTDFMKTGRRREKIAVGFTPDGLQIWCEGCNQNIFIASFDLSEVEKQLIKKETEKHR